MFGGIKMYLIGIALIVVVTVVGNYYIEYKNLQVIVANQKVKLEVMKTNLESQKLEARDVLVQAVASAVSKERKQSILRSISYDKTDSVSIDSGRYYIAY